VPPDDIRPVYAADAYEIDLTRRELRVRGSFVPVGGRAFQIIEVLARSAGELVTKDELLDRKAARAATLGVEQVTSGLQDRF
jgi:DNA-binding winged helix-turn-helix (wHTH) protein